MHRRQDLAHQSTLPPPSKGLKNKSTLHEQVCTKPRATSSSSVALSMMQRVSDMHTFVLLLSLASAMSGAFSYSLNEAPLDVQEEISGNLPTNLKQPVLQYESLDLLSQPDKYISVTEGEKLELRCIFSGNPRLKVHWIKGENFEEQVKNLKPENVSEFSSPVLVIENSTFVIDCVTPQDQNVIRCVGISEKFTVVSDPIVLKVIDLNKTSKCHNGASSPVITRYWSSHFSVEGSTTKLPCETRGNPKPFVYWIHSNGSKLAMDPRYEFLPNGDFKISNLDWNDMGSYKCVAISIDGNTELKTESDTFLYPAKKESYT